MKRRLVWVAAPLVGLLMLSGCGKDEPVAPPPVRSEAPSESYSPGGTVPSTVPMPTVRSAPEAVAGESPEAMAVSAQRFLEMWAVYNPAGWSGKEHWFQSWQTDATGPFRQKMRVEFDQLWSWTWLEEKSVCCVQFPDAAQAKVAGDKAVAKVSLTRSVQPLFATAAELQQNHTEEKLTYLVFFERSGGTLRVADVNKVAPETSLPEAR